MNWFSGIGVLEFSRETELSVRLKCGKDISYQLAQIYMHRFYMEYVKNYHRYFYSFHFRYSAKTIQNGNSTCDSDWQYECENKKCIPLTLVCDHVDHCKDGSDEELEICSNRICNSSEMFRCNSGQCILKKMECNGMFECRDKSDELSCDRSMYLIKIWGMVILCYILYCSWVT